MLSRLLASFLSVILLPGLAWGLLQTTPSPAYSEYLEPYAPYETPVKLPVDPVLVVKSEPGNTHLVLGIGEAGGLPEDRSVPVTGSASHQDGNLEGEDRPLHASLTPVPAGDSPSPGGGDGSALLLPDLQTLPPFDLRLTHDRSSGQTFLRFSNAIWNTGDGPLEMRGYLVQDDTLVETNQWIYRSDGEALTLPLGHFYFHEIHNHWHWEGFSLYEIWSVEPATRALTGLLLSSDKVGYCIRDDYRVSGAYSTAGIPAASPVHLRYRGCTWEKQGLAVGWADTYLINTPGQYLDVTGLPDGDYALVSTVNPYQLIHEIDRSNNTAAVYFRLEEGELEVLKN